MIRSMTGYGKVDATVAGRPCTIELRCVNGRYLEVSTRMPKEWSDKEHLVREVLRENVGRGSLTVFIRLEDNGRSAVPTFDVETARDVAETLRSLARATNVGDSLNLETLLRYDSVFLGDRNGEDVEVWPELREAIISACSALNIMRELEGSELAKDFELRLTAIETALIEVERRSVERIPAERERLRERVRLVVDDEHIDPQRLQLELVLLADKLDVTEECVRLRTHVKHFRTYMEKEQAPGRKLNFLLQEMNREVNTIGSKTNDAEIALVVVGMKEELERMREQVQNIE
ncbi:MAG TPA: YicC family protein [Chlorobiota bacterium]|nr:YicC family protein [Chlorobiota bacterium]